MTMLEAPLIFVDLFVEEEPTLERGKKVHSDDSPNSDDTIERPQKREQ